MEKTGKDAGIGMGMRLTSLNLPRTRIRFSVR